MKEILWEITLSCNKDCKYCGSKEAMKTCMELSIDKKMQVLDQIIDLKPESVDLTGGEPSVLGGEFLKEVIDRLTSNGISVKILTNGNLFNIPAHLIWGVDAVGFSINEERDIRDFKTNPIFDNKLIDKTTMITNFGTHNMYLFDQLARTAMQFRCWQVQLTMGDLMLDLDQIELLKSKLEALHGNPLCMVVEADNLNNGVCAAGTDTCGILANGDVVPCLSYRSWNNMNIQGNCLEEDLTTIASRMNKTFSGKKHKHCCKDITGIMKLFKKEEPKLSGVFKYGVVFPKEPSKPNPNTV